MNYNDYEDDFDIYTSKNYKRDIKKRKILSVLLIVFFCILILGIVMISFTMMYINVDNSKDLYVVYDSPLQGDTIDSFINYTSLDTSYKYNFYVENKGMDKRKYQIILSSSLLDDVNYVLYKNDVSVYSGELNDNGTFLAEYIINPKEKDLYTIKFWSLNANLSYNFKIDVK